MQPRFHLGGLGVAAQIMPCNSHGSVVGWCCGLSTPATSPFCIKGVRACLLCILCCHAQVWRWAPAGPEGDNISGWQHLRNHPHTAFYLSSDRKRGVESDIRQEYCVPTCYSLCFSLDIAILGVGREADFRVEDDGLGFKVESASMLEPRRWRCHAGGRFMQRARIISETKLLW